MNYNKSKNYHKQKGLVENIFDTLLTGLWFLISWPFKKLLGLKVEGVKFDKIANLRKWMKIESMLNSSDEIHAKQAIIDADKFFDSILKQLGSKGDKFADRLKNFENHFSHETYHAVWQAHKIRNQITHELEYKIDINEAKSALNKFRQGLRNLAAI